ncbi:MAG TPA: Gfo/Idh/MocA family oxidoreductase [Armatimonadota bacterium]
MKTVNIGVIGAGGIATNAHLPAYEACPNAKVVAIADINEEALNKAKEKFSIPNAFTDYHDLLAMEEVEAVSICTPNFMHKQPAIDAMRAGKHVLIEKPLAMNAIEAQEIVDVAKETGQKCQVAFVMRFDAQAKVLKRFIDAGEMGGIYYGRAQMLRRRGIPGWGVFGQKDKQGGGPLIDLGVHVLDLTLWLMGNKKPVSVSGISVTKFGNREGVVGLMGQWDVSTFTVEDFGAGFIRFDDGSVLLLEASFAANIKGNSLSQISLLGDQGGADMYPLAVYREDHGVLLDITPQFVEPTKGFELEIQAFCDAIINDTPVVVPVEDGLTVNKIIDGIYKSAELGREVEI